MRGPERCASFQRSRSERSSSLPAGRHCIALGSVAAIFSAASTTRRGATASAFAADRASSRCGTTLGGATAQRLDPGPEAVQVADGGRLGGLLAELLERLVDLAHREVRAVQAGLEQADLRAQLQVPAHVERQRLLGGDTREPPDDALTSGLRTYTLPSSATRPRLVSRSEGVALGAAARSRGGARRRRRRTRSRTRPRFRARASRAKGWSQQRPFCSDVASSAGSSGVASRCGRLIVAGFVDPVGEGSRRLGRCVLGRGRSSGRFVGRRVVGGVLSRWRPKMWSP